MSESRDVQNENENPEVVTPETDDHNLDNVTDNSESDVEVLSPEDDVNAELAALHAELEAAKAQIDENRDTVLRAKAEVENARRRADADVEKARKFALERFAGELLPVLDNLERAMSAADSEDEAVKPLLEGVEMTHKGFLDTVQKFGLELVDPQGSSFNPELHQAMSMQESDEFEPNTVMAVMQKGFTLNGRLLRPAMVMVSRAPSSGVDTQA
jgi:molecular chaperone GrpE